MELEEGGGSARGAGLDLLRLGRGRDSQQQVHQKTVPEERDELSRQVDRLAGAEEACRLGAGQKVRERRGY